MIDTRMSLVGQAVHDVSINKDRRAVKAVTEEQKVWSVGHIATRDFLT